MRIREIDIINDPEYVDKIDDNETKNKIIRINEAVYNLSEADFKLFWLGLSPAQQQVVGLSLETNENPEPKIGSVEKTLSLASGNLSVRYTQIIGKLEQPGFGINKNWFKLIMMEEEKFLELKKYLNPDHQKIIELTRMTNEEDLYYSSKDITDISGLFKHEQSLNNLWSRALKKPLKKSKIANRKMCSNKTIKNWFLNKGYTDEEITRMTNKEQFICSRSIEALEEKWNWFLGKGYTTNEIKKMTLKVPSLYSVTVGRLEEQRDWFMSKGYSETEINKMTSK